MKNKKIFNEYKDLPPCLNIVIYRECERMLNHLLKKEIGITNAVDFIYSIIKREVN